MSARSTASDQTAGDASVVDWRRGLLLSAGFAPDLAVELAQDRDVDVHAVLALVDRGCAPDLAARIRAPMCSLNRWSL
jgi:hypothetical protein